MFNISDYLKKFTRIEGDSLMQRDAVSAALLDVCGIDGAQFDIKKGVVTLKGPAAMKSLVFTRKTLLLETINARLTAGKVSDIR